MPQVMSLRESRERAERVYLLRAVLGLSWGAIRDAEGFTSVGGAQRAYERHRGRTAMPDARTVAAEIVERKRFTTGKAAAALLKTDDPHVVAELVRTITSQDSELAKLYGLGKSTVDVNVTMTTAEVLAETKRRLLDAVDVEYAEITDGR